MRPLISVIVPVYNVEAYLDRCMTSLVQQIYKNLEILLIDDGSTDNSPNLCDKWSKKDNRVKVIHKENGGLSSARNCGLEHAVGDYVGFVDSDDWVDINFFETLYNNMVEYHADISMVGAYRAYDDGRNIFTTKLDGKKCYSSEQALRNYLYMKEHFTGGVNDKIFKRELFENVKFPLGLIAEDRYVYTIILSKAETIIFEPSPLYYYYFRSDSISNAKFNSHVFDRIKIVDLICDYLKKMDYQDKEAIEFYKMKANEDVLYKLISVNAERKYIREYQEKTRKYYWKILKNKEVDKRNKVKLSLYCFMPLTYERLKSISRLIQR